MKPTLCAIPCAFLLILWSSSPTYGQDDTQTLQGLIDDENAPDDPVTGQDLVTIGPRPGGGNWLTGPLRLRSNLKLTIDTNVVIEANLSAFTASCGVDATDKKLFWTHPADPVSDLTIIGNLGATLSMNWSESGCPTSNFVHALSLIHTSNVEVSGLTIVDTGGDGIYIRDGVDVNVHHCTIEGANRNGIGLISGTDITIEDCELRNSSGKSPQAGLDVEPANAAGVPPNDPPDVPQNVRIRRCTAEGNTSSGFVVNVVRLKSTSAPVDVLFEDCEVYGAGSSQGLGIQAREFLENGNDSFASGKITFINCSVTDPEPPPGSDNTLLNHLRIEWNLEQKGAKGGHSTFLPKIDPQITQIDADGDLRSPNAKLT